MNFLYLIFGGGFLLILLFIAGLRAAHQQMPNDLKKLTGLLSDEWRLASWNRQSMGWRGKFEARGRQFEVSSHRGDVEIYEIMPDGQRETRSLESPKTPEQIYEFLVKAVA